MADNIRLGIIGTGLAVEKLHWPALKRMTDKYEVVAFSNRGRENAEHFSSYSGVSMDNFIPDYHELLKCDDIEAVLISLPIPLNLPVTREALEAGKDVICEKPTGANALEMQEFVELEAAFPDRTVLIAENWFYRDDLRFARSLLDEQAIGRVHSVAWRAVSQLAPREGEFSSTPWRHHADYVGGHHLDAGVHQVAQLRLLCGDAERIAGGASDANSMFEGPSDLTMAMHFVSSAIGSYTAIHPEFAVPEEPSDMRLYGTDGVMSIGKQGIRIFHPDGRTERWRIDQLDGGYYNEFLNFHEARSGKAPLVGTISQSVRNMEWITKALASAAEGRMMEMAEGPIPLSASAVPIWKPAGADGLFDGLDTSVSHEVTGAD